MRQTKPILLLAAIALLGGTVACSSESKVEAQYLAFLNRADRTPAELEIEDSDGIFLDPSGRWFFSIDLGGSGLGEVTLDLTVTFENFQYVDETQTSATLDAVFRFPDDAPDAESLTRHDGVLLESNGRMAIDIPYTRLEPERSPIEYTAVEVDFVLQAIVLGETELCGQITDELSAVFSPIQIQLKGVTFYAQKYGPQGQQPIDIPRRCPAGIGEDPDAGSDVGSDAGTDAPEDTVSDGGGLTPPDVDLGPGQRADISGRFWMSVSIAGSPLALNLIVDANYFEGDGGASVDGALRSTTAAPGQPAIATFSAPVDEDGGFTVVVDGLTADSTIGEVIADVALRAKIVDADTFCGQAAGTVVSPIPLELDGTTFGVVRLPDDFVLPTEVGPANAENRCP